MEGAVQKVRCEHIDIAKGIGILLVIDLHCNWHPDVGTAFEMPLFFLLSGIFVNVAKPGFLKQKVNTLLVPAFFCYLPIVLYCVLYSIKSGMPLMECFQKSSIPTALWFLFSLFQIHVIAYVLTNNRWRHLQLAAFLALSVAGYLLSYYDVPSYWFLNTSIFCSFYYFLGMYFKDKLKKYNTSKETSLLVGASLLAVCCALYYWADPYIFYRNNELDGNYFVVVVCAITGSLGIVYLSQLLINCGIIKRALLFYGQNSLIILCVHLYLIKVLTQFSHVGWINFLITVVLMYPTCIICRKYLPVVFGVKPLFK